LERILHRAVKRWASQAVFLSVVQVEQPVMFACGDAMVIRPKHLTSGCTQELHGNVPCTSPVSRRKI